jgi:hypothetical protein
MLLHAESRTYLRADGEQGRDLLRSRARFGARVDARVERGAPEPAGVLREHGLAAVHERLLEQRDRCMFMISGARPNNGPGSPVLKCRKSSSAYARLERCFSIRVYARLLHGRSPICAGRSHVLTQHPDQAPHEHDALRAALPLLSLRSDARGPAAQRLQEDVEDDAEEHLHPALGRHLDREVEHTLVEPVSVRKALRCACRCVRSSAPPALLRRGVARHTLVLHTLLDRHHQQNVPRPRVLALGVPAAHGVRRARELARLDPAHRRLAAALGGGRAAERGERGVRPELERRARGSKCARAEVSVACLPEELRA